MAARHKFAAELEAGLVAQVNKEQTASLAYKAISVHFDQDGVALHGFYKFFAEASKEETEHADKIIEYINRRGGKVGIQSVTLPTLDFSTPVKAFETAIALEKDVLDSLLALHATADAANDPGATDFLEDFIQEQHEGIKKLSDLLTNLNRAGADGLGLYLFDRNLSS
jgi:ferritin heavy chain